MKQKKVLVFVADGTEEIELACISDTLVRAGAEVVLASVGSDLTVVASRGLKIVAHILAEMALSQTWDMVVLPGGTDGAQRMAESSVVAQLLVAQDASRRWIAAICAAPALVLSKLGVLKGIRATCYPDFKPLMDQYIDQSVVVDQYFVTSQGPATALEFALVLVELLFSSDSKKAIAAAMLATVNN